MMNTITPAVLQQFPLSPNSGQVVLGSGFFLGTRTEQQQDQEEATEQQQDEFGEMGSSSSWQWNQEEIQLQEIQRK